MSRSGCTPDEAFGRLRAISQAENRKLPAVAGLLLDEAVGAGGGPRAPGRVCGWRRRGPGPGPGPPVAELSLPQLTT
jgi:hypothetical protein